MTAATPLMMAVNVKTKTCADIDRDGSFGVCVRVTERHRGVRLGGPQEALAPDMGRFAFDRWVLGVHGLTAGSSPKILIWPKVTLVKNPHLAKDVSKVTLVKHPKILIWPRMTLVKNPHLANEIPANPHLSRMTLVMPTSPEVTLIWPKA